MKNILLATTALVATAGFASAEVTGSGPGTINITGSAEIGVVGGNRYGTVSNPDGVAQFWTDVEVVFAMTGEADNGLTFGAKIDLDEAANANGTDDGGATWFLAYGNARLDMGDTDGALDWAMQEVNLAAGSIDDAETAHPGFSGNGKMAHAGFDGNEDGQIARFTYTFGDFAMALSAEVDDDPNAPTKADDDTVWGLGAKYSGDLGGVTLGVGLGYQSQNDTGTAWGVSVDAAMDNGFKAAINYSETDFEAAALDNQTHWAIGFGYEMNALAIGLNYGEFDNLGGSSITSASGFGLAVAYDLGGGLAAQFGYGNGETKVGGTTTDYDNYSLGLKMSF